MIDDDTSNNDVIPNSKDTNFMTKDNFIEFLHAMDDAIDSDDIDIVSFLKKDTQMSKCFIRYLIRNSHFNGFIEYIMTKKDTQCI